MFLHVKALEGETSTHLKVVPENWKHCLHTYMSLFLTKFLFNRNRPLKWVWFNTVFTVSYVLLMFALKNSAGTSTAVQWLRLCDSPARRCWFFPWLGNQDPTCHMARPPKKTVLNFGTWFTKLFVENRWASYWFSKPWYLSELISNELVSNCERFRNVWLIAFFMPHLKFWIDSFCL